MSALLVEVPEFTGPLDLLLSLIQRRRLDVTALSLAAVADQYLEQVLALDGELDPLSEFLTVASQLLLIKSRALLPMVEPATAEDDPAEDLRRRLAEYQVLQQAARWLGEREGANLRSWPRGGDPPEVVSDAPLAPMVAGRLVQVLLSRRPAREASLPPDRVKALHVRPSLRGRASQLLRAVSADGWQPLRPLLGDDVSTAVATFLALLVLVRHAILEVRQTETYAWLELRRGPGDPAGLPDPDTWL